MKASDIRGYISLASPNDIRLILEKDAGSVSHDTKAYIRANELGYDLLVNTWVLLVKQYSPYGWMHLLSSIVRNGLLEVIKEFDLAGDQVVHGSELTSSLAKSIADDVSRTLRSTIIPRTRDYSIGKDYMATVLFLFRYPKRFSPIGADVLLEASIADFKANERRMKMVQRQEFPWFIIQRVRREIYSLNWSGILPLLQSIKIEDGEFTPGACFECSSSLLKKLEVLASQVPEWFYEPMGTRYTGAYVQSSPIQDAEGDRNVVRIVGVPKTYKSARIVAPEELQRQMKARRAFSIIERILPPSLNLHDQSRNQEYARLGSINGSLATLDLSRASDCVTPSLIKSVFPPQVSRVLDQLTAKWYTLDKRSNTSPKFTRLQQFSTMGNALTFVVETVVFWAICRAACTLAATLTKSPIGVVSVYGDDCIVPSQWAATCVEWLEALGFIVNESKSFIDKGTSYRESCGTEWYKGINVSSLFWPRRQIVGTIRPSVVLSDTAHLEGWDEFSSWYDTTSTLVDLQHKLYSVCDDAAMYVAGVVTAAHPRMTYSTYGSLRGDLWGPEDTSKIVWAPMRKEAKEAFVDLSAVPPYMQRRLFYRSRIKEARYEDTPRLLVSYNYGQFLKHGPRYQDDLDRLLGVSLPPISPSQADGKVTLSWSMTTE